MREGAREGPREGMREDGRLVYPECDLEPSLRRVRLDRCVRLPELALPVEMLLVCVLTYMRSLVSRLTGTGVGVEVRRIVAVSRP
jgi:hypothetical protein